MNLILMGQASAMEEGQYDSDAIRLARVDFDRESAAILALPADMRVSAAALDDAEIEEAPLNLIYQLAYQAAESNSEDVLTRKSTQSLAQTVVDSFASIPDHYVTVRGGPFMQIVDSLGGRQTLDYVRLLLPAESEHACLWERCDRQNQVLQALPELIKVSRRILVTDLSTNQAGDLACMVQEEEEGIELIQLLPHCFRRNPQTGFFRPIVCQTLSGLQRVFQP